MYAVVGEVEWRGMSEGMERRKKKKIKKKEGATLVLCTTPPPAETHFARVEIL